MGKQKSIELEIRDIAGRESSSRDNPVLENCGREAHKPAGPELCNFCEGGGIEKLAESAKRKVLRRMMRKDVLAAAGLKELSATLKVLCDADFYCGRAADGEGAEEGMPLWERSIDRLIERHNIRIGESEES